MLRRASAVAIAVAIGAGAPSLHAQPSVWDVARDPRTARSHHALVAVERMLMRADMVFDPLLSRNFTRAGLAMLELAGGEELPDARVHYLLGELLLDASVSREEEARKVLTRALQMAPDSPLAGRGWFNLAIASAKLDDPAREHSAYTRALQVAWEPRFRANILINRAESSMVLGDLRGAIRGYRAAIRLAAGPDHQALAHYGLGIALERSGDLPAALEAMRVAENITLPPWGSALDLPGVFFVPSFDKHYYRALGAMAIARDAADEAARRAELERALDEWRAYLKEAEPANHTWVKNAELHVGSLEKQLAKLGAKPAAKPKRR